MKNLNLIPQRDPHRRVTTIYLPDGSSVIVEVIEWGSGSTPILVRTVGGQIWRQGVDENWSSYPNQSVAYAFRQLRQTELKQTQPSHNGAGVNYRKAA